VFIDITVHVFCNAVTERLTVASSDAQVKQLQDQLALEQQKSETLKKTQQLQTAKQVKQKIILVCC